MDANGNPISLKQLQVLDGAPSVRKTPKVVRKPTPGTGKIPGQTKKFVPAKTIKEAEKFAQDNGLARVAKFGKLDIETANEMNKSMLEGIERMPALKGRMSFIGSIQENNKVFYQEGYLYNLDYYKKVYPFWGESSHIQIAKKATKMSRAGREYAFARNKVANKNNWREFYKDSDGIAFNEKWGSVSSVQKLKDSIKKDVRMRYHPEGTEALRSVMDHEIGHQIDYMLNLAKNTQIVKLYKQNKPEMTQNLSTYAKKNIKEFIAESWSEYINNPTPRPLAKQVGDIMNAEYQNKFGDFGS